MNFYFIWERERERERASGGHGQRERERERKRESQAGSMLIVEPKVCLNCTTLRSWPEPQSRVRRSANWVTQVSRHYFSRRSTTPFGRKLITLDFSNLRRHSDSSWLRLAQCCYLPGQFPFPTGHWLSKSSPSAWSTDMGSHRLMGSRNPLYSKRSAAVGTWTQDPLVRSHTWPPRSHQPDRVLELTFFPLITALLRYNSRTVKFTFSKYTIQWFFIYSQNCASIKTLNFRTLSSFPKETPYPFLASLKSLAITNLFAVSTDLSILDISYKLSDTIYALLWLASSTYHTVLKVRPQCRVYQNSILFTAD